MLALCAVGCMSTDPVLTTLGESGPTELGGVPAQSAYVKPAGLLVDVPHLAGKSLDVVRPYLEEQLGSVLEVRELDEREGS